MAQTNPQTTTQREALPPKLIAWHVSERDEKAFWTRIGAVWDHKDGERYTLQLDLVPASGGRIVPPGSEPGRGGGGVSLHPRAGRC